MIDRLEELSLAANTNTTNQKSVEAPAVAGVKIANLDKVLANKSTTLQKRKGGQISRVIDGDTVELVSGETIRLGQIDTYETDHRTSEFPNPGYDTQRRLVNQKRNLAAQTNRHWSEISDEEIYTEGNKQTQRLKDSLGVTDEFPNPDIEYNLSGSINNNRAVGDLYSPGQEQSINSQFNNPEDSNAYISQFNIDEVKARIEAGEEYDLAVQDLQDKDAIFTYDETRINEFKQLANAGVGAANMAATQIGNIFKAGNTINELVFEGNDPDSLVAKSLFYIKDAVNRLTYAVNKPLTGLNNILTGRDDKNILEGFAYAGDVIGGSLEGKYNRTASDKLSKEFTDVFLDSKNFTDTAEGITNVIMHSGFGGPEAFIVNAPFMIAQLNPLSALATFMGNATSEADNAVRSYIKEFNEVPSGGQKAVIFGLTTFGAAIDYAGAKYVMGSKINILGQKASDEIRALATKLMPKGDLGILLKATGYALTPVKGFVVEAGQEGTTAIANKLAAVAGKRDLTELEKAQIGSEAAMGGLSGATGKVGSTAVRASNDLIRIALKNAKTTRTDKREEGAQQPFDASDSILKEVPLNNTVSGKQVPTGDKYEPRDAIAIMEMNPPAASATTKDLVEFNKEYKLHISNMVAKYSALSEKDKNKKANKIYLTNIKEAIDTHKSFVAQASVEDIDTISDEKSTTKEKEEASARTYGSINSGGLNADEINEYLNKATGLLTEDEVLNVKAVHATTTAREELEANIGIATSETGKSIEQVHEEILNGNVDSGQLGGEQHIQGIVSAVEQGNLEDAQTKLKSLEAFSDTRLSHRADLEKKHGVEKLVGILDQQMTLEENYLTALVKEATQLIANPTVPVQSITEITDEKSVVSKEQTVRAEQVKKADTVNKVVKESSASTPQDKIDAQKKVDTAVAVKKEVDKKIKIEAEKAKIDKEVKTVKGTPVNEAIKKFKGVVSQFNKATDKREVYKQLQNFGEKLIAGLTREYRKTESQITSLEKELDYRAIEDKNNTLTSKLKANVKFEKRTDAELVNALKRLKIKQETINTESKKVVTALETSTESIKQSRKTKVADSNSIVSKVVKYVKIARDIKNRNPDTHKPYPATNIAVVYKPGKTFRGIFASDVFGEITDNLSTTKKFKKHIQDNINKDSDVKVDGRYSIIKEAMKVYKAFTAFKEQLKHTPLKRIKEIHQIYTADVALDPTLLLFRRSAEDGKLFWTDEIVAAMSAASSMWLREEGNKTFKNYHDDIRSFLGLKDTEYVSKGAENLLANAGVLRTLVARSIGKKIYNSLGIELQEGQSEQAKEKMIEALGQTVLHTMQAQGLIEFNTISFNEIAKFHKNPVDLGMDKGNKQDKNVVFVQVTRTTKDKLEGNPVPITKVTTLTAPFDKEKELGNILFGLESFITGPTSEPTDKVQEKSGDGFSNVPEYQRKVLGKHNKRPNRINTEGTNNLFAYGDKFVQQLMGYKNIKKSHKQNVISNQSINDGIDKDIRSLKDSLEEFGEKALFFTHEVWSNSRMGIVSNTLNPQASKLHRFFVQPQTQFRTNLDPSAADTTRIDNFKYAVALAFGAKEKAGADNAKAFFEELTNKNEFNELMQIMQKTPSTTRGNKIIELLSELSAVDAHAYSAAQEMVKYTNAVHDGKTFDTWVAIETDGVTNGSAIGMAQFPVLPGIKGWLARMGIFVNGSHDSYPDWNNEGNNLDSYEFLMEGVMTDISIRKDVDNEADAAITLLIGKLIEDNAITKAGRDFAKNPFMIFNYGSSIITIREGISNSVVDGIYNLLEDINNMPKGKERNAELAKLRKAIKVLAPNNKLDPLTAKTNLLTYNIEGIRWQLGKQVNHILGQSFDNVLKHHLSAFTDIRDTINNAFKLQWKIFDLEYQYKLKALKATKPNGVVSKKDIDGLVQELSQLLPAFNGPMSKTKDARITIMKIDKQFDSTGLVKVLFQEANNIGAHTASSHVAKKAFIDGGVSGLVKMVHTIDASIMTTVLDKYSVLNVHDAVITNIDDSAKIAKYYNEKFYDVTMKYHIIDDVINMIKRGSSANLTNPKAQLEANKYAQDTLGYKEIREKPTGAGKTFKQGKVITAKGQRGLFDMLLEIQAQVKEAKAELFNTNVTFDQMVSVSEESAYGHNLTDNTVTTVQGSSDKIIDPAKFNKATSKRATSRNVRAIYNNIQSPSGIQPSVAFKAQLDRVMDLIITKGIKPLDKIMFNINSAEKEVFGGIIGTDIYINNGQPIRQSATAQTVEEVFVHEFSHAVLGDTINTDRDVNSKLTKLFDLAKKEVTWQDFLRTDNNGHPIYINSELDEIAEAKRMYDYIFNNTTMKPNAKGDPINDSLHEFVMYGLTNEQFVKKLKTISTHKFDRTGSHANAWEYILDLLDKLLDRLFSGQHRVTADNVSDEIFNIAKTIVTATETNRRSYMQLLGNTLTVIPNTIDPVVEGIKSATVKVAGTTVDKTATVIENTINKTNQAVLNEDEHESSIKTIVKSIKGLSNKFPDWFDLLRESKSKIDQLRQNISNSTSAQILNGFLTETTIELREALTKTLLNTDIDAIINHYKISGVIKLLEDKSYLTSEIIKHSRILNNSEYGIEYIVQAKNLGMFMVTSQTDISNQMMNATNIAAGASIGLNLKVDQNVVNSIDTLATLYAIQNTTGYTRNLTLTAIKNEYDANAKDNGITNLLTLHRGFKEHSKAQLFAGNERLMIKGYIADVSDPSVKLQIAPTDADTQNQMKEAGFILDSALPHDPNLSDRSVEVGLYVSRHNASTAILKATVSITDTHNKGTLLIDTLEGNAADKYNELRKLHRLFAKQSKRRAEGTTSKDKVFLIPITDRNGIIVNYRYMMSESAKSRLLDKNYDAATVMGAMTASVISKVNSEMIDKKVVDIAYEDYKANYNNKTAKDFVLVSGKSGNYYEEISTLLPDHMKEHIRKLFGSDGMYIRKELADVIFGYRKMSISNASVLKNSKEQKDIDKFNKYFGSSKTQTYLRRISKVIESVWQEIIAQEKVNIVIKTPQVLFDNVVSNSIMLLVRGISPAEIYRGYRLAVKDLNKYQEDSHKLQQLNNTLRGKPILRNDKKFMSEYARITNSINTNSVKELVDQGIFQTIVEDVAPNKYGYKGQLNKWVGKHVPGVLRNNMVTTGVKLAYITEDTKLFKLMHKATAYSDFMGRYVLYNNQIKKGVNKETAILDAVDSFINYDAPDAKELQYLNDMGLFMFTKFFLRIQRIMLKQLSENTTNSLLSLGVQAATLDASDITDSNPIETGPLDRMYPNPIKHIGTAFSLKGLELLNLD